MPGPQNWTGGRQGRPPFIVLSQYGRALSPGGHGRCRHCSESVTAGQAQGGLPVGSLFSAERARVDFVRHRGQTDKYIDFNLGVLLWAEKLDWRPAGPAAPVHCFLS